MSYTLELQPGRYAVVRMGPKAEIPEWAMIGGLYSVTRTLEELSIVCSETSLPAGVQAQTGFRCLMVQGPLAFSQVGVLAALAEPLAEAGVSIFVLSTYDTDYLMVLEDNLAAASKALTEAGHRISRSRQ